MIEKPKRYYVSYNDRIYGTCYDVTVEMSDDSGGKYMLSSEVIPYITYLEAEIERLKGAEGPSMSEEDAKWWYILWAQYPRVHGTQQVPVSAKAATLKRFKLNLKKHKVTSEQLVRAVAAYVKDMAATGRYIVGLQSLLGDNKAYWVEYIER